MLTSYVDTDSVVSITPRVLTHEGFRAWAVSEDFPETGQYTYLNGELLIDMSPERLWHAEIKGEITFVIERLARERSLGRVYPDGTLVSNSEAGLSTEPDATFVSHEAFLNGRVRRAPKNRAPRDQKELEGTPDWVLEVVSPSSTRKDTILLPAAYHRAGVPEYWMVKSFRETHELQILLYRPEGYQPAPTNDGWQRSELFGNEFRLESIADEDEQWQFSLQVR